VIEIVPATAELLDVYFGETPAPRIRGYVALLDGRPIGVGGFAYRGGTVEVFSNIKPEMKQYRVTLFKVARMIMRHVEIVGLPAFATPDPDEPTADRFLARLGFERVSDSEVFRWRSI
jgi:hypothetical protein